MSTHYKDKNTEVSTYRALLLGIHVGLALIIVIVASASASALVSTLLVWGAYDATKMDEAMAAGGTALVASEFPSAVTAINFAFGGLSMVASIACFIIMLFYDLDGKMPEIRETLEKRKAELGQTVIDD